MVQYNFIDIFEQPFKLSDLHRGELLTPNGLTKHQPRRWTIEEENYALKLREKGFTTVQIAQCLERDFVQVSIKLKRLMKKTGEYNDRHQDKKYQTNDIYLSMLRPNSVLDLFAGPHSYYEDKVEELYTNDINETYATYYNQPAEELARQLLEEEATFDLVDVDPFGAAFECLIPAVQLAQKGLIVTFGELGHKRFKRLDYVGPRYGINTLEEFSPETLSSYLIEVAKNYNKELNIIFLRKWHNIARAYYVINTGD